MITKYDFRNDKDLMENVVDTFGADFDIHNDLITLLQKNTEQLLKKYSFKITNEQENSDNKIVYLLKKNSTEAILNTFMDSVSLNQKNEKCIIVVIPSRLGLPCGALVICLLKSNPKTADFDCFSLLAYTPSTPLEIGYLSHISQIIEGCIHAYYEVE